MQLPDRALSVWAILAAATAILHVPLALLLLVVAH